VLASFLAFPWSVRWWWPPFFLFHYLSGSAGLLAYLSVIRQVVLASYLTFPPSAR
jgi:hypothetical protein